MRTRVYSARLIKINSYFTYFPPKGTSGNSPKKLPQDELVDIMEFGCPVTWQKQMVLQDFDVTASSIPEFVAFCERLERAKRYSLSEEKKDKSPSHGEKKSRRRESSRRSDKNSGND